GVKFSRAPTARGNEWQYPSFSLRRQEFVFGEQTRLEKSVQSGKHFPGKEGSGRLDDGAGMRERLAGPRDGLVHRGLRLWADTSLKHEAKLLAPHAACQRSGPIDLLINRAVLCSHAHPAYSVRPSEAPTRRSGASAAQRRGRDTADKSEHGQDWA